MKRIVLAVGLLGLAGCEQTLPPTAEGLKLIAARTAKGTKNTKLETKTQPSPPRAGSTSIWDFKVFDIADKPDGNRKEWKFLNPLPQSSTNKSTTGVQMNAWLISKDLSVFLPQRPYYKQYGSFITDWNIPQAGPYTLWAEYQPVKAKDELSFEDTKKAPILEVEHAHWDVTVDGDAKATRALAPSKQGDGYSVYSLSSGDYAANTDMTVTLGSSTVTAKQKTNFVVNTNGAKGTVSDYAVTALSPSREALLHGVGDKPQLTFDEKGTWRVWVTFSVDDKPYVAPIDVVVS